MSRSVFAVVSGRTKRPSRVLGRAGSGCPVRWPRSDAGSRPARAPEPPPTMRGRSHRHPAIGAPAFNPQAVPIPDLLRDLLTAAGPSGHEEPAAARLARGCREVRRGARRHARQLLCAGRRRAGRATLALVGHIDEIGVAVTHIDADGLLAFTDDRRVREGDPDRPARRDRGPRGRGRRGVVAGGDGACTSTSARDCTSTSVRGCCSPGRRSAMPASGGASPSSSATAASSRARSTTGSAPTSRSRRLGGSPRPGTRRSTSSRSRRFRRSSGTTARRPRSSRSSPTSHWRSTSRMRPTFPAETRRATAGSSSAPGPRSPAARSSTATSSSCSSRAAEEEQIPHAVEVFTRRTGTDADDVHKSRGGVPTGIVSIPLRYMHSPGEIASLDDLEAVDRPRRRIRPAAHARDVLPPLGSERWPAASSSARCGRRSESSAAVSRRGRPQSSARSRSGLRSSAPGSSRASRST